MECFYPITGYQGPDGKVRPGTRQTTPGKSITIACGQCTGCRLERSRQWAVRIMHEAQMHEDTCWITLTYNKKHLPEDKSLVKADFQKMIKRWRRWLIKPEVLRYYMCGEYGEEDHRPHYHACIFGQNFPDQTLWRQKNGNKLYRSKTLEKLWPFGHSEIGTLTQESAGYTARYIMKKQTGDKGVIEYGISFDHETGEVQRESRIPPYNAMSLKPGIGRSWIQKYHNEVYLLDEVISNGHPSRPPRYYDSYLERINPEGHERLKATRLAKGRTYAHDNTPARLRVKEEVLAAKTQTLKRDL